MVYKKEIDAKGITRFKLDNKFIKADDLPLAIKEGLAAIEGPAEINTDETTVQETPPVVIEKVVDKVVIESKPSDYSDGMGFPMIDGKTVDIFNGKPHETIKFVDGKTVPLTLDNYKNKTVTEISNRLKELGL